MGEKLREDGKSAPVPPRIAHKGARARSTLLAALIFFSFFFTGEMGFHITAIVKNVAKNILHVSML